jgi:phage I-like protein
MQPGGYSKGVGALPAANVIEADGTPEAVRHWRIRHRSVQQLRELKSAGYQGQHA